MSVVIADGIYEILYAADPTKSIDCRGANDKIGANIWLYNRNHSAAQYWSITNYDDGVQIVCTLSGRAVDLANNSLKNGTNIRQWEDNNTHAQRWDIVADGKTVTLNGTTYNSYVIKSHGTSFAIDVSGGGAKSGTNIQIYSANSTDAQRWIFIPIPYFNLQGTYKIVSAMDSKMCLDVAGGSTASKANVQIFTDNNSGAQGWLTFVNDDQTMTFLNAKSMKALNNYYGVADGNAIIYPPNHSDTAQCFFVKRQGTIRYDGQIVPTFSIQVQSGSGSNPYVLDVYKRGHADRTNVFFHEYNGGDNQLWALIPEAVYKDWGTGLNTPAFLNSGTNVGNGRTTAQFKFICSWSKFQIRARFRVKQVNANSYTDWSIWKSAYDGLGGNAGWGDAWTPNITFLSTDEDVKTFEVPIPDEYQVDGRSNIALDCEVEMRAFQSETVKDSTGASYPLYYHGAPAAFTKSYYWKPTAQVASAQLSGAGLLIGYTSDLKSGGCTVEVWYGDITAKATGKYGGSGQVLIPSEKLTSIPSGSITCYVRVASSANMQSDIASGTVTVTDSANRATVTITQDQSEYGTHLLTIAGIRPEKNADDHIILRLTYGSQTVAASVRQTTSAATVFEAVSPLDTSLTALIWMIKSDGTWDVQQLTLNPISNHACCWTFEGGGAVLDYGLSSQISQEDSVERDAETYKIIGRDYEAYRFKKTKTRDLSVTGVIVNNVKDHGTYDQFVALLNAGHATYRNKRGEILPVAVTAISKPLVHPDYVEIKVTQHEESR